MFKYVKILKSKKYPFTNSLVKGFTLVDDINVIYGANGSGKTNILLSLAVHGRFDVGFSQSGWSEVLLDDYVKGEYEHTLLKPEWSGMPLFYMDYEALYDRRKIFMGGSHMKGVNNSRKILFHNTTDSPSEVFNNLISYLLKVTKADYPDFIDDFILGKKKMTFS